MEVASARQLTAPSVAIRDRSLNSAIHTAAVVQIRMPGNAGRAYRVREIVEGIACEEVPRASTRRPVLANHDSRRKRFPERMDQYRP